MMNKLITLTIALISIVSIYGQNVKPDSRLEVKFSKNELKELKENNSEKLEYLNFCIDNAFTIMPLPSEKAQATEIKGKVNVSDLENINFFELGLEIESANWQYYVIEGTQNMIVVYSEEEIKRKIKK